MTEPGAQALTTHELLLALAGRVDDDLLATSRELAAIGEDGQALELLTATLIADRTPLPPEVRRAVVTAGRTLRIGLDAEQSLPRPARENGTAHRFQADAERPGGSARINEVLTGPAARQLGDCRIWLTWRITPAGSAPGPVPHPVVLVEIGSGGPDTGIESHTTADVLAYQLAATLDRAGARASVEAFVAGSTLPDYHAEALRSARPVPTTPANVPRATERARRGEPTQADRGLGAAPPAPADGLAALLGYPDDDRPARINGSAGSVADRAGLGRSGAVRPGTDRPAGDRADAQQPDVARPWADQRGTGPTDAEQPAADRARSGRRSRNGYAANGLAHRETAPERTVERSGATPRPAPQPIRPADVPPLGIVRSLDTPPPRPAVPLRPAPSPSPPVRPTSDDAAPAAAEQPDEDVSAVSETTRFAARPPAAAPAEDPSPTARPAEPPAPDRDSTPAAADGSRPTPSPRPAAETADDENEDESHTDPPVLAEMNDPLSGPLRQPLLDPLLDPTLGTTNVPSVSPVPSAPSVLTPLPQPSLEADRAAADERGRRWADEWASGAWAMPSALPGEGRDAADEEPADHRPPRPAPPAEPRAPWTGRRRARHRSDPDTEQDLDATAVTPAVDEPADESEPAAEAAAGPAADSPGESTAEGDGPGPDAMAALSSTERELLRQLHAELAARERRPRSARRAGTTNGSNGTANGSANGVTPPRRIGPPDLAG
ncbi:hypothetical protein [Pseudonocardia acidicola]|uniref:Basic proline-rich protein n=1 Tax=Pseudonocardia acidicola TaxID=2724939 RepID=A0ABX1SIN1_9PSEU|nr:hypothetical protein [Pseudonocardia acidicola]NMI00815.1 hypothetical protein [Pseudonocardia acidicola]